MKITKDTKLIYDYFSEVLITMGNIKCFYYENHSFLDSYQLRRIGTDTLVVCSETKEELLDYLISQNTTIKY